jgi:protocatechuate 3,4-dioxygenase beta subunit
LTYAERSVEVETLPAGGVVENVSIELPAEADKLYVAGAVVDSGGAPVPGVNITLKKGELGTPEHAFAHAQSDGLGRFEAEFKNPLPGVVTPTIYHPQQFKYGAIDERTGRECAVLEGGVLEVREGETPAPMRIVVAVPPLVYLAGTVEDAEGRPLDAKLTYVHGDYKSDSVSGVGPGYFLTHRMPDEPFLLEVVAQDYKPKILRAGEDFDRSDPALHIVLEPGPFADDASVWTEVTGQPDTEEAIAAFIQGEGIKRKEEEYRRVAQADELEHPAAPSQPRPTAPEKLELIVTDAQGDPVTRLVVHGATVMGGQPFHSLSRPIAAPATHAAAQVMSDPQGHYIVPNGSLVEAPGTARYLVRVGPGEDYTAPIRLKLERPASVTVHVTDHAGTPVEGVALGAAESIWHYLSSNYHGLPKTDAKGRVTLEDLPPGDYALAVVPVRQPVGGVMARSEPQAVFAHVEPGEEVTVAVTVGAPKAGSPEAIFQEWMETRRKQRDRAQPPTLDAWSRRAFESWIIGRIEDTRVVIQLNRDEVDALATAASEFNISSAVEPLKALATRITIDPQAVSWYGGFPNSVITAIAELDGNDAVPFMESLAGDATADAQLRSYAVVALGAIGAEDAVAAYKRLRDAAYGQPGAPEPQESYTHGERMAEAAMMTLYIIPGIAHRREVNVESARIDDTYSTGEITAGDAMSGATTLKMRRFGDEWLIVEIGPTVIA